MAKFGVIYLGVDKEENLVGLEKLNFDESNKLRKGNIVYIYRSKSSRKIYIGQSKSFINRHKQHFDGNEEKFNEAKFDEVLILFSSIFNRSALDDVENQLIEYFIADSWEKRKKVPVIQFDEKIVINGTIGNTVNDYKERVNIASDVILPFWESELYARGWVKTQTINEIREQELIKYSPIKKLTEQQMHIITDILEKSHENFVINGDAGTGKTILLTHLVAKISSEKPNERIAVVVQPNWIDTATKIFKVYGLNSDKITVATSTKLINMNKRYDVIVVDESHKLSRRGNKQHPSFNKVYEVPGMEDKGNHLEILTEMTTQLVLMYDVLQAIRPANISRNTFSELTKNFHKFWLTTQFRIQSKNDIYTSDDYINGIKYLLYKDTELLSQTNFDADFNRKLFSESALNSYFGIVTDNPMHTLFDWIDTDRNFHPEHVNRVLGGLVEPWKQSDGKDSNKYHWIEGDLKKRWNSTQNNWINSSDEDAEDQIGSVFAVQGIDLNKVGVLIGNDLQVDKRGHLFANRDNFHNINGVFSSDEADIPDNKQEFTLFVLNIYYILLTRGIDGIRVGFWHNPEFEQYFVSTLLSNNN